MGILIYSAITSVDGYVDDVHGRFDWSVPPDRVHAFVKDRERSVTAHLFERRVSNGEVYLRYAVGPSVAPR